MKKCGQGGARPGLSVLTGAGLDGVDLEQEDEDAHEVRHVPGEPEGVHLAG
jgi:hypothetical protein